MPNEVKEMLGLPSKNNQSGTPGLKRRASSERSKFGELTPRRLEKFEQHFKRRARIRLSTQGVQVRSPEQKCSHGGQPKKTGKNKAKSW
jgi:hypothetical protein